MLKDKKVAELREVAEFYGVELDGAKTKKDILSVLEEEGVSDEILGEPLGEPVEADSTPAVPAAKKRVGPEVLVKMERANPTYEILGFKFTKLHPYIAMGEEDAQRIFDHDPRGFKIATPSEVKEYYS